MLKIKGIDISRAQEQFDFTAAVSAGVKFVIIRAGIRTDEDTYFRHNLSECLKRNIPYGLYWYFEATSDDTFKAELSACKKAVKGLKPAYPIFFDAEEQAQIDKLTTAQRTDMALKFCTEMTAIGLPSGIYANPSWMKNYYDKSRLSDVDIWLAHWTESSDKPSRYDYGQKMWQWGIDSIGGNDVDGDICFVNYPAITAKWYKENCGDMPEKPDKPDKPENLFKKGDSVRVKRGARFTNGVEPYSYVYDTIYTVQQVSASGKETLIGIGSVPTGWLYTENLYKAEKAESTENNDTTQKFAVGDKVKVNYGAKTYNGGLLALFVYTNVYEVMQAGSGDREDYIVIGQGGQVTAAVKAKDLKKV